MDKKLKYYDLMEDCTESSADSSERGIYLCGTWTWNVLFGDGETHG